MIIGSIPGAKTQKKKEVQKEEQATKRREEVGHRLFIGNLDKKVTDTQLHQAFSHFPSLINANVVMDKRTGHSKGFGFVSLREAEDARRALREMQAKYVGAKPIKVVRGKQNSKKSNKSDDEY